MKKDNYITKKAMALNLLNYKNLCLEQLRKTKKMIDALPEIHRENMYDFISYVQKVHTKYLSNLCKNGVIAEKDKEEYLVKLGAIHSYNELEEFLENIYQKMKTIDGYYLITLKEFLIILVFPWFLYLFYILMIQL